MIAIIWHGWTTQANADAYETLLRSKILPGIVDNKIAGFARIELSCCALGPEVEFVTIMWFDSLAAVKAFAGNRYQEAVVRPAARALLERFDQHSRHYEVRDVKRANRAGPACSPPRP